MEDILFDYQPVRPMNWVYFSSLLAIALYFKFSRVWSVRNIDLIGLLLFAPGLVLVQYDLTSAGFIWLFAIGSIFMVRLLFDSAMVRRPLLEPNLSVGGMTFLGVSLLLFLMTNVAKSPQSRPTDDPQRIHGPIFPLLLKAPVFLTQQFLVSDEAASEESESEQVDAEATITRAVVIFSHIAVVFGMIVIGYRHFDNVRTGVAASVLYLLMPYTAQTTGQLIHVLPAALLVWAIAFYRRPMIAGMFIGFSLGVIYYPLYLLPLWISFYWRRGLFRFCSGMAVTTGTLVSVLAFNSVTNPDNSISFWLQLRKMFGLTTPALENLEGFWNIPGIQGEYRVTVLAVFVVISASFALWPAQKSLGTLLSCTAALMLGAQFWHGYGGGLFMAWYLPLLLLTVFRPNLEDRVALAVIKEGRRGRKPPPSTTGSQAG